MALTDDEQQLLDFALAALPAWMRKDDDALRAAAKEVGAARRQADYWFSQTLIKQAQGATSTQPDWLNQHARDRGTSRQTNETDAQLAQRLRVIDDALTRKALITAGNSILATQGIGGTVAIVELPRDGAFSGSYGHVDGLGGTFAHGAGSLMTFTPSTPFNRQIYRDPSVVRAESGWALTFASSLHSANNGTFAITGVSGSAAIFTNASGVAELDASTAYSLKPMDSAGNVLTTQNMAYASRGYRSGSFAPRRLLLILPYGSTATTTASITEMLRQKKAAGIAVTIETRAIP